MAGFGVLVWFTPPSKSAKRATAQVRPQAPPAAKPVPAQPTNYSYATPKPTQPLMRTNPTAVPKASGPVVAKTPAPALTPPASSTGQEPPEGFYPRPVRDVAEAQIALARVGISSGSIDGLAGAQTRGALLAFQRSRQLPETGQLDPITREALLITRPPFSRYTVMEPDLARLQPLGKTWAEKAQQTALEYETVLELVAEKSRAHPDLLRRLNPPAVWLSPSPGTTITVPDTELGDLTPCEFIRISLTGRILEAYDSGSNLVAHFPCSIARQMEKRPAGELRVVAIAPNPNYTFNPELFPESAEARELGGKLVLPPGPNNPVGVAWIGLDKPGYGIHGTPSPEQVGRTESHGCFRLANWNAEHLLKIIRIGIPVYVEQ
ncbi:MAG TPA: L,D-transpeptidase [Verrucomicrobiae bacterium]